MSQCDITVLPLLMSHCDIGGNTMRIFVTGASGWIGSAVIPELLSAGHQVVGLARSGAAAEKVAALGVEVRRGELDDLDGLRAAASASEGVVHLGYNHDFARMPDAARTDLAAITAMGRPWRAPAPRSSPRPARSA
jgi:nucleoside-diphosphate-sugar epimerase